jgi:hypothetical protein
LKVSPDRVKQLGPGECFVIVGGCAQEVRVSQVVIPKQRDLTTPSQGAPARSMIEGIDAEQRRSHRRPAAGLVLRDMTGALVQPPALETDTLTFGAAPAPLLSADHLSEGARSGAAHGRGSSVTEHEHAELGKADELLESGGSA